MKLSIVTINMNNAEGLERTLNSVLEQSYERIEHVIVDGGSTDGSVDVIKSYVQKVESGKWKVESVLWVSEPDNGIYNGMNKGIEIALGRRIVNTDHTTSSNSLNVNRSTLNESLCDYVQILNSGDILAASDVVERMVAEIEKAEYPELLYGNMIRKDYATGKIDGKSGKVDFSLRQYYRGTMNHDCCYIRRVLFEIYGLYDENLKIVSDWKWFLLAIGLGNVKPLYADIDVTIFDASGISETNLELRNKERRQVLEEVMPPAVLADYDRLAFPMEQYMQLKKYHLWGIAYFMERVLFKLNRWGLLR